MLEGAINFVMVLLSIVSLIATMTALLMMIVRPTLLKDISLETMRKNGRIGNRRKKGDARRIFDCAIRCLDISFTLFGLICIAPVILVSAAIMMLSGEKSILDKSEIVGRYGKSVTLFRLNTKIDHSSDGLFLKKIKVLLDNTAFDMFPVLINIIRGDIALFGLARIPYAEKEILEVHYQDILEQYSQYRPGYLNLYVLDRKMRRKGKPQSERLEDIRFSNSVFLQERSWKLIAKMFTATIVSATRG